MGTFSIGGFVLGFVCMGLVALYYIKKNKMEAKEKEERRYISHPEEKYEDRARSVNMNVPTEFINNGPVEINVRSKVKKKSFILVIDGRDAGIIGENITFIKTLPGMHDIIIKINNSGRREIYHEICRLQQFTQIAVSRIICVYHVRIKLD